MLDVAIRVDVGNYKENLTGSTQVTFGDDHVGGCNIYGDPVTELPKTWKYLVDTIDVKSVIDVGCGFGFHSYYFKEILNCETLGIEGSRKVVERSLLPNNIIWHDYSLSPFTPSKIYDMVWCIECVEHIEEKFVPNFMETFKKSRYVVMTHGTLGQGGYHHVNCQPMEYWVDKMSENGFTLMEELTEKCRELSMTDNQDFFDWLELPEDARLYRGPAAANSKFLIDQHYKIHHNPVPWGLWFNLNGLVFKNNQIT